jgi:acetyl-CoA carboxylase carboxyltransferase component
MMGAWTGVVDLTAKTKLNLIAMIREIVWMFGSASREEPSFEGEPSSKFTVLSEEMIRKNVDSSRFLELKSDYSGAKAIIGGLARLGGRPVLILGPRSSIERSSPACDIKFREMLEIAYKSKCPQILIFKKEWLKPKPITGVTQINEASDFFNAVHSRSGTRIHIILNSKGLRSFILNQAADVVILVQKTTESLSDSLSSNLAHFTVPTLKKAFELARQILDLTEAPTQSRDQTPPPESTQSSPNQLRSIEIPINQAQSFDVITNVISPTFDSGSFIEFHARMNDPAVGPSLVTGLARLHGRTVAIIADQPKIIGGAPDSKGTEKFRKFVEFVARKELPLIMLSSAPGFLPGIKQERLRIQAIGARSLDVNIKYKVPVVSVVLNKNFGGRLIQAFNKFLRPGIVYLAMEESILAVMGPQASFDLFGGTKYQEMIKAGQEKEAVAFKTKYIEEFNKKSSAGEEGVRTGLVDWLIPSKSDLSQHLLKGLKLAEERCEKVRKGV